MEAACRALIKMLDQGKRVPQTHSPTHYLTNILDIKEDSFNGIHFLYCQDQDVSSTNVLQFPIMLPVSLWAPLWIILLPVQQQIHLTVQVISFLKSLNFNHETWVIILHSFLHTQMTFILQHSYTWCRFFYKLWIKLALIYVGYVSSLTICFMCSLVFCQCQVMRKHNLVTHQLVCRLTFLGQLWFFFLLSWSSVKVDFKTKIKPLNKIACHQMTNVQLVADCSKNCILSKCDPSFGLHGDRWLVALPTQLWLVRSTRTTNELQTESGKLPVDKILSPSLLQILDIHIQMCVYVSSELTDLKRWICWWKKKMMKLKNLSED